MRCIRTASLALVALVAAVSSVACSSTRASSSGTELYRRHCARCHGQTGAPPPSMAAQLGVRDLSIAEFQDRVSDEQIRDAIYNGSSNRRMPAFQGALSDQEIAALVAHVRALGGATAAPPAAPAPSPSAAPPTPRSGEPAPQ
ncbi:MAG: cytochrome c [Myxococcota bacterium]